MDACGINCYSLTKGESHREKGGDEVRRNAAFLSISGYGYFGPCWVIRPQKRYTGLIGFSFRCPCLLF